MSSLGPKALVYGSMAWFALSLVCRMGLAQERTASPRTAEELQSAAPSAADAPMEPAQTAHTFATAPAEAGPEEADPTGNHQSERERARALFWTAHRKYDEGSYLEAAALFEQSYALLPQPELLFNIALARARGGECDAAWERFEHYSKTTGPPPLDEETPKRARIAQYCAPIEISTDAHLEQSPAPTEPPEAPDAALSEPAALQGPARTPDAALDDRAPKSYFTPRRTLGWSLIGTGVLAGGAALYLGSEHYQTKSEMERLERDNPPNAGDRMAKEQTYAERTGVGCIVSTVAALALLGAGSTLLIIGETTETAASVGVDHQGTLRLGLRGAF